tara:strand:- start:2940 stop:3320 length:381 start_codon:yes stop_codon:yes gene_type:complete
VNKDCELCVLDRIDHVFYNDDDFIIIACDSCHVPMAVVYDHIDPTLRGAEMLSKAETEYRKKLFKKMENALYAVAYQFYDGFNFYIDKKENKIPNHMHWHARPLKSCNYNPTPQLNQKKLKQLGII